VDRLSAIYDVQGLRHELGFSQGHLAELIGVSPRTVQSWEQGWRKPSPGLLRSVLLLALSWRLGDRFGSQVCWETVNCSPVERARCLAYQSKQGHLCWFLTGNACRGRQLKHWSDKIAMCAECPFFGKLLHEAGLWAEATAVDYDTQAHVEGQPVPQE
jgi:DNA-binding XRE family transcriptional regulator